MYGLKPVPFNQMSFSLPVQPHRLCTFIGTAKVVPAQIGRKRIDGGFPPIPQKTRNGWGTQSKFIHADQ
jgi:hypothetical protein